MSLELVTAESLDAIARRMSSGGEPPTIGPVEARLSEVEKSVIRIDGRLDAINVKLDIIASNVSSWKWQLLAAVVAIGVTVFGTSFAIQQMTVATFQAAAAQAQPPAQTQPTIIMLPSGAQVVPPSPIAAPSAPKGTRKY